MTIDEFIGRCLDTEKYHWKQENVPTKKTIKKWKKELDALEPQYMESILWLFGEGIICKGWPHNFPGHIKFLQYICLNVWAHLQPIPLTEPIQAEKGEGPQMGTYKKATEPKRSWWERLVEKHFTIDRLPAHRIR